MVKYVVQNIDNVVDSSNEIINRHVINRNFEKLLENDKALNELLNSPDVNKSGIRPYSVGLTYDKDDLVWFVENDRLFLLRSIISQNSNVPVRTEIDKKRSFDRSGWHDEYEYGSVITESLSAHIIDIFNDNIETNHSVRSDMHRFGTLTDNDTENDRKLLRNDLTNADPSRLNNFWPGETIRLEPDNVVMTGFCRKWDVGVLEYDIIFRVGYTGEKRLVNGAECDVLRANTLMLEDRTDFESEDDADIFAQPGPRETYINETVQTGLNGVCEAFSGRILFPVPFKDNRYMVFGSDTVSQTRDTGRQTIDSGCDTTVYVNRTASGMDALVIIRPETPGGTACLVSNSFHCRVVGRWK